MWQWLWQINWLQNKTIFQCCVTYPWICRLISVMCRHACFFLFLFAWSFMVEDTFWFLWRKHWFSIPFITFLKFLKRSEHNCCQRCNGWQWHQPKVVSIWEKEQNSPLSSNLLIQFRLLSQLLPTTSPVIATLTFFQTCWRYPTIHHSLLYISIDSQWDSLQQVTFCCCHSRGRTYGIIW